MVKPRGKYIENGYMYGTCPECKDWEAAITESELRHIPEKEKVHMGTGEREVDEQSPYFRTTWLEYFKCPKCQTKFTVKFSSP